MLFQVSWFVILCSLGVVAILCGLYVIAILCGIDVFAVLFDLGIVAITSAEVCFVAVVSCAYTGVEWIAVVGRAYIRGGWIAIVAGCQYHEHWAGICIGKNVTGSIVGKDLGAIQVERGVDDANPIQSIVGEDTAVCLNEFRANTGHIHTVVTVVYCCNICQRDIVTGIDAETVAHAVVVERTVFYCYQCAVQ